MNKPEDLLKTIIKGEDWHPEYLMPTVEKLAEPVSVILATYNRSPFDPGKSDLNPLEWCLASLLAQRPVRIRELVIINDASSDFTPLVIEKYEHEFRRQGVSMEVIDHADRLDLDESRNIGSKKARSRLLYFLDDDCILPPFAIAGLISTYLMSESRGANMAVLTGPVYQRSTIPANRYCKDQIFSFDPNTGLVRGNYDGFPREFESGEKVLDDNGLLKTLCVQDMSEGHAIISKKHIEEAGGFRAMSPKNHGGGTGLACAMLASGMMLRYSPDPRLHAMHLRYGNEFGRKDLLGPDWNVDGKVPLVEMVREAGRKRRDTGCRVDPEIWHYAKIRNYAVVMLEFRPKFVETWLEYSYKVFVEENQAGAMAGVPDKQVRERIWSLAREDALSGHFDADTDKLTKRLRL